MIYLNRTCFNGIYRVNCKGEFNVPMGTKTSVVLDTDDFETISKLLQNVALTVGDFSEVISQANVDDFIFADPPYTVRHNLNGFVKYNEKLFSWEDQERLAQELVQAKERGAKIMMTNANHKCIRELYGDMGFKFKTVSRYSPIAASSDNRKQFEELIISVNL
jgi:DNA adenine methylase